MNLLIFECKKIVLNKIYAVFFVCFVTFMLMKVNPISFFRNVAPMDSKHIIVLQVIKDSQKKQLENQFIDITIDELNKSLIVAQINDDKELIWELEGKIALLMNNRIVTMNNEQKTKLIDIANILLQKIENGKLSVNDIVNMDTDLFQKCNIDISNDTLDNILDDLDTFLGGYTYYSDNFYMDNSDFRNDLVELNGFNSYTSAFVKYHDDAVEPLDVVDYYSGEVDSYGYYSLFMYYIIDKLEIVMCLLLPIIILIYNNSNKKEIRDLIYLKKTSSLKIILLNILGLTIPAVVPLLFMLIIYAFFANFYSIKLGYTLDFFKPIFNGLWIICPEIVFIISLSVLIVMLTDSFIPSVLVSSLVFGISIDDYIGQFNYDRVIIRFNCLGNVRFIKDNIYKLINNRLLIFFASFILFIIGAMVYSFNRHNNNTKSNVLFTSIYNKFICFKNVVTLKLCSLLQIMRGEKKSIFVYQFKIEYKACVILCLIYNIIVYILFAKEMEDYMIIRRFYPMNILINFLVFFRRKTTNNVRDIIEIRENVYNHVYSLTALLFLSYLCLAFNCLVYHVNILDFGLEMLILSMIGICIYIFGYFVSVKKMMTISIIIYCIYLFLM